MPFTKMQSKSDFVKFNFSRFLNGSPDSGQKKKSPLYNLVGTDLPSTNVPSVRPEPRPLPSLRQGQSGGIIIGVSFTAERRWRPRSPSPAAGQHSAGLTAPGQQALVEARPAHPRQDPAGKC